MLDPVHWNGSKAELSSLAKEGSYPGTGPRWTDQDLEVFMVLSNLTLAVKGL